MLAWTVADGVASTLVARSTIRAGQVGAGAGILGGCLLRRRSHSGGRIGSFDSIDDLPFDHDDSDGLVRLATALDRRDFAPGSDHRAIIEFWAAFTPETPCMTEHPHRLVRG